METGPEGQINATEVSPNGRKTTNTRMKTTNTKLQTPEKFQITSSKATTSRAELGFGAWDFFGVWILKFGVLFLALLTVAGVVAWPEEKMAPSKSDHWAFRPAIRPVIPEVKNPSWGRNGIDNFVLARLEFEKLAPSREADG